MVTEECTFYPEEIFADSDLLRRVNKNVLVDLNGQILEDLSITGNVKEKTPGDLNEFSLTQLMTKSTGELGLVILNKKIPTRMLRERRLIMRYLDQEEEEQVEESALYDTKLQEYNNKGKEP